MNLSGAARPAFSFLLVGLLARATPCLAADFQSDVQAWSADHTALFEQAASLTAQGYPADGNQVLLTLAQEDGSPIAAYVIGNTLYGSAPAASYRLHLRAQQGLPDEPAVILPAAMEQHRRREYPAAIVNYHRTLAAGSGVQYSALLADCLLRTGKLKEAVEAWNRAGHDQHHAAIDRAICKIYGPLAPAQRRGELIAKLEAGDLTKLTDLILLDLAFDTDWWNAPVNDAALDADLKRAAQLLGRRDARYQQLALYAKLASATEKKQSEIQQALKNASLIIGPGAVLPDDSQIARALCELAVNARLATAAELWTTYQAELRSRLEKQDHDALHLLCWLAAANRNPELTELDRLGWEDWNDPAFASGYTIDLYREKKITSPDDSQLLAAMAVSPDNTTLNNLRIALAGESVTREMIAGAIKAEYHKLSVGETIRDSSRLNSLYDELGKRL